MKKRIRIEAHRGVGTDYPENTFPAFEAASMLGYDMIELDLKFTSDDICVALHDSSIARTARTKNGLAVQDSEISEITFAEARAFDYGVWKNEKFRGTDIPLFSDILAFAKKNNISLKIDNCYEDFPTSRREKLYKLIEDAETSSLVGFTCANILSFDEVSERFPTSEFHYDGIVNDDTLSMLRERARGHRTTVWIPLECPATAWVSDKIRRASAEIVDKIHSYGFEVGVWILQSSDDFVAALSIGTDIIETDGSIMPK